MQASYIQYSIPQNKTVFLEVNYNDRAFSTMKKKREILDSSITILQSHFLQEIT